MKKETFSPPALGGSSLLTVFALLTLCVFALLSLSTVLAEKRLSDAATEDIIAYYAADLQAEQTLARLRCGDLSPETSQYLQTFPISVSRCLLAEYENDGTAWQLVRRQVVAHAPGNAAGTLPVWDGNLPQEVKP